MASFIHRLYHLFSNSFNKYIRVLYVQCRRGVQFLTSWVLQTRDSVIASGIFCFRKHVICTWGPVLLENPWFGFILNYYIYQLCQLIPKSYVLAGTRSDLDKNAVTNTEPDMDLDLYLLSWNYYPSIGYFCTLSDTKCQKKFLNVGYRDLLPSPPIRSLIFTWR